MIRIQVQGFDQLVSIARSAYHDLRTDYSRGIGGLNALVLLSAERNHLRGGSEPEGSFSLYNLPALGLRYSYEPDSIANSVAEGKMKILRIVAEPTAEEGQDGL
jgi:hypothetical protein